MMRSSVGGLVVSALVVIAVAAGFTLKSHQSGDRLTVVMPNAIGVVKGTPVQLQGFDVGHVTSVTERDNKAVVELAVGALSHPLHAGTTVDVEWRSVLGERYLQLKPGPESNPVLPSGAMLQAGTPQVEVGEILQSLDGPTRAHLASFLQQLNATMTGHQQDFNATVRAAGPTVQAFGAVLNAVGRDGQSIKTILANLRQVTSVLAERKVGISSTVLDLNRLTSTAAVHERQLSDGIAEMPAALDSVNGALGRLPAAADATVPLLEDLRPAAHRLPGVARNLTPVMRQLKPTTELLGPTLDAMKQFLGVAPDFLDQSSEVLPQLRTTLDKAGPAVNFLRPYTPEIMGGVAGWGNLFAGYDSVGHFLSAMLVQGTTGVDDLPNITTPGGVVQNKIAPGAVVDQPWSADAAGSGPR